MIRTLAVLLVFLAFGAGAASVYRCEQNGETIFSQQPCDDTGETVEVNPAYEPGAERAVRGQVKINRKTCRVRRTGTTEAIVELLNTTSRLQTGELMIQFSRRGSIIGSHRVRFSLASWQKETVSRLGPSAAPVDNCEYVVRLQP